MALHRFLKIVSFLFVLVSSALLFLFPSIRKTIVSKSADGLAVVDRAVSLPFVKVESKANDLKNLAHVYNENASLKSSLYQNDVDRSKLDRLSAENKELKSFLNIKDTTSSSKQMMGEIVDRNYSSWDQEFVIDKGSSDGVEKVESHSSNVKLLVGNDIASQHLTLKIDGQGQSIFALLSGFDDKTGEFRLLQIGEPVDIKKGSLVSTSGLGNYKSSDLPVGTVTSVKKSSDQLGQEIRVKPKANLDVERYVLLIGE